MRGPKMAELKFEAPLAKFDTDEWLDFEDHQGSEEVNNLNRRQVRSVQGSTDNLLSDNFSETVSDSLEDLVSSFDEKITKCFKNYAEKTDKIAPVQIRTQEEIMNDCQMWWTITGNFGNILPIDWSKSYARQLHMPSLNLFGRKDSDHDNLDMSDDEELAQAFDMHSLIVSSTNQEPVVSADDVIDEIDEIMQFFVPSQDCD
ncbi:PREDICTED: fasciculation and elongation protein zeta-2-like [Priapulus caudatus]|uniref:Fasciculation and elongation protein zeta-2-like n=1 Tax=Priapulus caudatus TaxID=37621 RepID=A0ABM1EJL0_PRICU|nr:PREDICTED: fasciculation and elongation protein zeta-2-like [Priapulus caudatus]